MVTLAEERAAARPQGRVRDARSCRSRSRAVPRSRRSCAAPARSRTRRPKARATRLILEFRADAAILNFVNGAELARYSQAGVVTPDHTIRTKNWPLVVPAPEDGKLDDFKQRRAQRRSRTSSALPRLFRAQQCARRRHQEAARSAAPRRAGAGPRPVRARPLARRTRAIAADLAEAAIETITDAEAIGRFESISEADMFDVEYWSLEQAKLGKASEKPLAGQIAAITGAGGAHRRRHRAGFAAAGAEVALLDLDRDGGARRRQGDRRRRARGCAAT